MDDASSKLFTIFNAPPTKKVKSPGGRRFAGAGHGRIQETQLSRLRL